MDFAGKTIIITGASKGVGLAATRQFFDAGANVVLCARSKGPLDEAAATLGDAGRVLAVATDVGDNEALNALVEATVSRFGAIHGLVNNAGAHFRGPFDTVDADQMSLMVDVNLRGPIVLTRLVLPHLHAAGEGFVVNVASLAGKVPLPGSVVYSSTKWGLRTFTFALREELRDTNITASAVSPGPIETGFILEKLDEVSDMTFSQPMCSAGDVADMVVACARDGVAEREWPKVGAKLATMGYLFPALRRVLEPVLKRRGKANRKKYMERFGK